VARGEDTRHDPRRQISREKYPEGYPLRGFSAKAMSGKLGVVAPEFGWAIEHYKRANAERD
jgi:hypothetical protein